MSKTLNGITFSPADRIIVTIGDCKIVAVIGYCDDWAAYQGDISYSDDYVAEQGDKIARETAEDLFAAPVTAGLHYRE